MTIKLIGAFLVFAGCGGFGFTMAAAHRREEAMLHQYISALEFMECDLSYRLSPLPQLCRAASNSITGPIHTLFRCLAEELEAQVAPDVSICVKAAISGVPGLSHSLAEQFAELGGTLGRFDLPGQLKGIHAAIDRARLSLESLAENRAGRLRSYQTLGLCAGAALAILFL